MGFAKCQVSICVCYSLSQSTAVLSLVISFHFYTCAHRVSSSLSGRAIMNYPSAAACASSALLSSVTSIFCLIFPLAEITKDTCEICWDIIFFLLFFFVVHSGIIERTLVSLWEEVVHFTSQRVTSADPNTAVVSAQLYKLYKAGWDSVFLCYVIIYENHTILTDALWQSVCRGLGDRVQSCGLVVKYAYPGTHISLSAKGHLKMLVTTHQRGWPP